MYGLEWVTVRLQYCTGEEVLREERLVLRALLVPVLRTPSSSPSSGPTTRSALQLPPGEFCECHFTWRIVGL
jgi:hypothetical protein